MSFVLSFEGFLIECSEKEVLLVFPAASSPNMSKRISLDPNSLPIIFETCPPMITVLFCEVLDQLPAMPVCCAWGR